MLRKNIYILLLIIATLSSLPSLSPCQSNEDELKRFKSPRQDIIIKYIMMQGKNEYTSPSKLPVYCFKSSDDACIFMMLYGLKMWDKLSTLKSDKLKTKFFSAGTIFTVTEVKNFEIPSGQQTLKIPLCKVSTKDKTEFVWTPINYFISGIEGYQ